jgi:hypothetical protein
MTLHEGSDQRPKFESTAYTVLALVFFFGVGLAGGAAYRFLPGQDDIQTAEADSQTERMAPADLMPTRMAQDLAAIVPTEPPLEAAPMAEVAPPSRPVETAAVPEPAPEEPTLYTAAPADPVPAPAPQKPHASRPISAAKPSVAARQPVPPAEKPKLAEKSDPIIHSPPTAPGSAVGPYRIQFGAFANEDNARRVQWAVEATGVQVEVAHTTNSTGHLLYYLRSPGYTEYGVALSAAQTVQARVGNFVNAIPIEFVILGDQAAPIQQAQIPSR